MSRLIHRGHCSLPGRRRQLHDAQAGNDERSRNNACDCQRLAKSHNTNHERGTARIPVHTVYAVPSGSVFMEIDSSAKLANITRTVMAVPRVKPCESFIVKDQTISSRPAASRNIQGLCGPSFRRTGPPGCRPLSWVKGVAFS